MVCAAFRDGGGQLDILFCARAENGGTLCASTPDNFTFDVKLHQLFSFHSTPAKLLPPDLRSREETDAKGNVKATPRMQEALLKCFLRGMATLRSAGKLGPLLLQLSPAFSPRKHNLSELGPL